MTWDFNSHTRHFTGHFLRWKSKRPSPTIRPLTVILFLLSVGTVEGCGGGSERARPFLDHSTEERWDGIGINWEVKV